MKPQDKVLHPESSRTPEYSHNTLPVTEKENFGIWLIIGVVLINLIVMMVVAFSIVQNRELQLESAKVNAQNLVDILGYNINNDIAKVDIVLQTCVDEIERTQTAGKMDGSAITAFLARQQQRLSHIESLRATDEQGTVLYGLGVPAISPPSVVDRDFFIRQRDNANAGLVINKPVLSRLNKIWMLNVSRRTNHPDGSFAGVIYSGTALAYYDKMFLGLDVGKHGAINLRDQELGTIARYPTPLDITSIIGDRTISPEYRQHLDVDQQEGTFYTPTSFDGVARIVSYQKLADYPLYISVGLSEEDYLSEWRRDSVKLLLLVTFFALISVILMRLLYTAWSHQMSATKTLYKSQSRLNALFENMSSGVAVYRVSDDGQQYIFTALNRAAEQIENLRREDVIGKNVVDISPNIVEFGLLDVFQRVLKTGVAEYFPVSFYRDGRIAGWRENYVYRLPGGEIVAIYDDVTQRKQSEDTLHENEMRLRIMGDNLPDSYLYEFTYQDGSPCFLHLSSGVERVHGVKIDDALRDASVILGQIAPEQQSAYIEAEHVSRRDMTDFSMDLRIQRAEGECRWIHARSHPRIRKNDQVVWDGIVTDITDRYLYETEINRLAQAVEQNPTGILITDVQGALLFTNQAYTRITGYQFAEVYGRTPRELLSTEITDMEFDQVQACLAAGKPWTGILRNRHKNGSLYWEQLNISPIFDDTGTIRNYLYLRTDITESKCIEEELRRYKDHLEEQVQERTAELVLARDAAEAANRAKSVFLANMSHELRTPLNAILGFSNLMSKDPAVSNAQVENLNIINRSGEHLLTLINDILDMAKIEAGRVQLENLPFDLGGMVRDVTDMMQIRAQEKGLQLLLDQSSAFPRFIKGDEARLRQVLINLIGNAVKFTEQGGISVRLNTKENTVSHLLIEIEDSGKGISPEDQQRIFEPFIQVGDDHVNQGSGLGLSITRQFVQLMGGTLSVKSTSGMGSLFQVDLPLQMAYAADMAKSDQVAIGTVTVTVTGLAPNQPVYRILIVDDQLENQLLLSKLMDIINFPVQTADNGAKAIEQFNNWQPHLIWMDSRMPMMDGMEATRHIRELPGGKDVKIVAVTASAFIEQRTELLNAGMDDFIRKPYRFNEIYDCLSRLLGVQYLFESTPVTIENDVVSLSSDMLAALSSGLRYDLKEALESLDNDRIGAIIARIEQFDAKLGKILSRFVANFDYPSILKALSPNERNH
jgi:PAS domain S-box-containing protein